MRSSLENINQSLWLSELASECSLVIPMDTPAFGEHALLEAQRYDDSKLFHKSALYSLVIDNMAHPCYQGNFEMRDLITQVLYRDQPNLATV